MISLTCVKNIPNIVCPFGKVKEKGLEIKSSFPRKRECSLFIVAHTIGFAAFAGMTEICFFRFFTTT